MAIQFYTTYQNQSGNKYEVSLTYTTWQGHAFLFCSNILVNEKEDADTATALTTPQKHSKAGIQDITSNTVDQTSYREEEKPSGSHQHEQLDEITHQIESIYKRITTIQNIIQHDILVA